MKTILIILSFFCSIASFSQTPPATKTEYPLVYVDNVKSDVKQMHKIPPADIISVTTLSGQEGIDKVGPDGKYGVMYVQTRNFVKSRNWKYLGSKSPEYLQAFASITDAENAQYVLNGRLLNDNIDKTLGNLNDKNFRSVVIINQDALSKEYRVKDKKYGVIILADPRQIR